MKEKMTERATNRSTEKSTEKSAALLKAIVIDDEIVMVNGLIRHVKWEKYGFERAIGCNRPTQALELIQKEPFDLIITDIRMPELSGLELIAKLREAVVKSEIVIISGYGEFEYAQEAIRLGGVKAYLLKPVKPEDVERILEEIWQTHTDPQKQLIEDVLSQFGHPKESEQHPTVKKILRYVTEHYKEELTVNSIAETFAVNASYLSSLFKKETGMGLNTYIQGVRILSAKKLLERTDLRINEVAWQVGFANPGYFAEQFKNMTGKAPSEVRKELL